MVVQLLMKKTKKHILLNNQNYILKDQIYLLLFLLFFFKFYFLGIQQNSKKINGHNTTITEKIQSLRSDQQISTAALSSQILTRSTNGKQDVIVAPTQSSSRKLFHTNF